MLEISFEQLRSFLAVVKYHSFSRAAEKIFRTQAALSIQVARLEELTGTRLFNRTTKSLELTGAGRVLHKYLSGVEALLKEAKAELGDLQELVCGRLVLCTSDTTACYQLPLVLQLFTQRYRGIEIIVQNATSPRTWQMVLDGRVDLGIVTLEGLPASLVSLPLFQRRDVLICHPGHPLAGRKEILLKDLEAYPAILLDQNCATRQILDQTCRQSQVNLQIAMELSSVEVIKRFVRINAGISVIPQLAVSEEVAAGQLALCRIQDFRLRSPVQQGVIYKSGRYLSAASRGFLDLLQEHFGGDKAHFKRPQS